MRPLLEKNGMNTHHSLKSEMRSSPATPRLIVPTGGVEDLYRNFNQVSDNDPQGEERSTSSKAMQEPTC